MTTDAMGCQKAIARQIVDQGGHYLLALQGNHGIFEQEVTAYVDYAQAKSFAHIPHALHEDTYADHGRIAIRKTWSMPCDWYENRDDGADVKTLIAIESTRIVGDDVSTERRLSISDLHYSDAKRFHDGVSNHWGVENNVHWQLAVTFQEDQSRIRKDHAPANMSLFRRLALNLLKKERSSKVALQTKRLQSAWSEKYMLKVLGAI